MRNCNSSPKLKIKVKWVQSAGFYFPFVRYFFVIDFTEPCQKIAENEHNEQCGTRQHEVPLRHVVLSQFLVNDDVVVVLVGLDGIEIIDQHIPGV